VDESKKHARGMKNFNNTLTDILKSICAVIFVWFLIADTIIETLPNQLESKLYLVSVFIVFFILALFTTHLTTFWECKLNDE